jgi:hypothetical protein
MWTTYRQSKNSQQAKERKLRRKGMLWTTFGQRKNIQQYQFESGSEINHNSPKPINKAWCLHCVYKIEIVVASMKTSIV